MLISTPFRLNAILLIALVSVQQALALKCTFSYFNADQGKEKTISDPQEDSCLKLDFQAYKVINRCYLDATIYVGAHCDGNSAVVKGGDTYSGRHDIFKSVKFE